MLKIALLGLWSYNHNILEECMYQHALEESACPESEVAYPEYSEETGTLLGSFDDTYDVDKKVQTYLKEVEHLLETTPLRKIQIEPLAIEIIEPKDDGRNGYIRVKESMNAKPS